MHKISTFKKQQFCFNEVLFYFFYWTEMYFFPSLHLEFIYPFELVNLFKFSANTVNINFINVLLYFCFNFRNDVSKM